MSGASTDDGAVPFSGRKCLILEDEFLIALEIENILENAGAQFVSVTRVNDAIAAIDRHDFELAILDYKIERETSGQVAEKLRAARIPFVFITGLPAEAANAPGFKDVPVVDKPFDSATLLAALSRALAARR